jgi:hypothetical protein
MKRMHVLTLLLALACTSEKPDSDSGTEGSPDGTGDPIVSDPVVPDCAWFSEDNCWKEAIRAVDNCLPESRSEGRFDLGFQTCSFDDGSRLQLSSSEDFSNPFEWSSLDLRAFQLEGPSGSVCLSYLSEDETSSTHWAVNTTEGEVRYDVENLMAFGGLLSCPNGTVYDLGEDVLSCPDANAHWPFISHSASGGSLSFSLQGGDEPVTVFVCVE